MSEQHGAKNATNRHGMDMGHGVLLNLAALGVAAMPVASIPNSLAYAQDKFAWDKTFTQSDRVEHKKVTYQNRLGITLVADLYVPKNLDRTKKHAALVVGTPFGAVKEQASGLYAQTMAERGFITIAHDPSYIGESGGQPHGTASSEALVEDFSAGVDYLGSLPLVNRERIGVIGVCGSGGFGLAAAEIDPRIKAVATVSMYDIGQAKRQGLADALDMAAFKKNLEKIAAQRWAEVDGAERTLVIGTPQILTDASTAIDREFFDYYRTPRGQHPRATTAFWRTSDAQMSLFWSYEHLDWISPRPVLFITGDQAHSRIFSQHAYKLASKPKELFIVPGAGHVDLYDRVNHTVGEASVLLRTVSRRVSADRYCRTDRGWPRRGLPRVPPVLAPCGTSNCAGSSAAVQGCISQQLALVVGDALFVEHRRQLARFQHLADDVAAADELALHVELRDGEPEGRRGISRGRRGCAAQPTGSRRSPAPSDCACRRRRTRRC